jgi:hypothetical protein
MVSDLAWLLLRTFVINLMVKLNSLVNIPKEVSLYLILDYQILNQFPDNLPISRTLSIDGSPICLKINSITLEIIEV